MFSISFINVIIIIMNLELSLAKPLNVDVRANGPSGGDEWSYGSPIRNGPADGGGGWGWGVARA